MNKITRRRFIKLAAVGAVASGALGWPASACAANLLLSYRLHGDGWDDHNRRSIVAAAMDLVSIMSDASVIGDAYRLSGTNYQLTGGTWDRTDPNSNYRGLGYKDVLTTQLTNLAISPNRPMVNIYPYHAADFSWGKANYDLVSVRFSPGRFVVEGEFNIKLNHYWLGGGGNQSSPAVWASVICHEMLHNLGHMHGERDYRTSLQINALQQAVFLRSRGIERVVAASQFRCGGRAS